MGLCLYGCVKTDSSVKAVLFLVAMVTLQAIICFPFAATGAASIAVSILESAGCQKFPRWSQGRAPTKSRC